MLTGLAPGWHLEYVDVHDDIMGKKFRFQCDRWLAKNEDDGQIMRELACANNDAVDFDEKTSETDTFLYLSPYKRSLTEFSLISFDQLAHL